METKDIKKLKKAIDGAMIGYDNVKVKIDDFGISVFPAKQETCIFSVTLEKIQLVAKYFGANVYVDFGQERLRIH